MAAIWATSRPLRILPAGPGRVMWGWGWAGRLSSHKGGPASPGKHGKVTRPGFWAVLVFIVTVLALTMWIHSLQPHGPDFEIPSQLGTDLQAPTTLPYLPQYWHNN